MKPETDPEIIAAKIGIPVVEWPGRCHEIAGKALKAKCVRGRLSYGHYIGRIAKTGHFAGRPFAHHGWIELSDDLVWDPTRWVFEDVEPYIFIGSNEAYDFGGNLINAILRPAYPRLRVEAGEATYRLKLPAPANRELRGVVGLDFDGLVDKHQLHWLANVNLNEVSRETVRALFREIIRLGWGAHIPLDNRERVLGKVKR